MLFRSGGFVREFALPAMFNFQAGAGPRGNLTLEGLALAPGGRLVYITCSMLRAENDAVVSRWLESRPDARCVAIELPVGQPAAVGWQILPGDGDLDGMYYAVLEKA